MPGTIQFDVWGSRGSRSLVPARSAIANNTACYSVLGGAELVVFDAGRGLAALAHALSADPRFAGVTAVHILVTHAHMDHWEGLKDAEWFWRRGNGLAVRVLACTEALDAIRAGYAHPGYVPLDLLAKNTVAGLEYHAVAVGEERRIGRWTLRCAPLNHYSGEASNPSVLCTLGFRLEAEGGPVIAYISDHEPTPATRDVELQMLAGAHLAVYDSQFSDIAQQVHGHGSQEHAARMAREHPGVLILAGHLGATISDAEIRDAQQRHAAGLPNYDLAAEGVTYLWTESGAFKKAPPSAAATDAEREAAARRSKARHDLRTPINQIIGYSEMLAEQAEEEGGREAEVADLQKIRAAARRQLELIDLYLGEPAAGTAAALPAEPAAAPPPPAAAMPPAAPARTAVPAAAPTTAEPPPPATKEATTAPTDGHILVVDDNPMNRDMLARRLESRGFTVSAAENGQQALEMVAAQEFELILLDVMMPGISGLEVLEVLRRTHAASDLPVIMATARDQSEDIVTALRLGANDYVTKPLDFPVVLARVQTQLAVKRQKDEIERLAEGLEKRNRFIRNTFGRYLSDEVVSGLLDSSEGLRLGGESRTVTILMSDLRGFTQVSERLGPEQVVRMLNMYLGVMADIIFEYQGTIDEFIGDAILAIFGAPVSRDDDPRRAVACAVSMQRAMQAVNEQLAAEGLPSIEVGIAVHTGPVVVGNIGSQKRTKYGIVGPPVNLTGRIESYTVGGQVLVSEATLAAAGPIVRVGDEIHVKAKGATDPVTVYDLAGIGGEYDVFLPQKEEALRPLGQEIAITYALLEGKRIGDDLFDGAFVRLSPTGAEVRSSQAIRALSNLQIRVRGDNGAPVDGDLYAKVLEHGGASSGSFLVRFTSVPPDVEAYLRRLLA